MEWLSKWKAITQTSPFPLPFNISGSFLFLVPLTAHTSPSQAIHHIRHLIPPVLSFLASLLVPHNVLLPSSSQPLYALFCLSSVQVPPFPHPFPCQNALSVLSAIPYDFFFASSSMLWTHKGATNWTQLVTKDLSKREHLCCSHFYFEISAYCVLTFITRVWLKAHSGKIAPIIFPCCENPFQKCVAWSVQQPVCLVA